MPRGVVAVVRTRPETVLEDTVRAFELAGGPADLARGAGTIIKDNISWHYPFPSANTTPWQLEASIIALRRHGFDELACVQNKTEVTNAVKGETLNCFTPVLHAHEVRVLFNFREEDMCWVPHRPRARLRALHRIYGDRLRIPDYFFGRNVLHLPTVKCHIYTTTTGAMKNAFGGLLNHKRHQTHTYIHETLVDLLAIQQEIHPGIFCIMDGTTAGNGTGPRIMKPVEKNVILASADQVAIDALAARMMGFDPMQIPYLRMAHEDQLGVARPEEMEVVGDRDAADERWGFAVGRCFHQFAAWVTWFGPTRFLQSWLTRPPILWLGNLYSSVYHDLLHWRLQERHVYERWLQESGWGQLFQRYLDGGAQAPP
jgi:uncharacterized protein (DUF362 family)